MGALGFIITSHATERFISRHAQHMSFYEAKQYLKSKIPEATLLSEKTPNGREQWLLKEPPCILVMVCDWEQRSRVCVTVLKTPENYYDAETEELLKGLQEGT